ncbi:MAG: pentapeptide repeat-containing protein [Nannocystaceae bacterium]|nr:pentapeptide repeat-containing protein [Nannocystaceae bacterium]
MATPKAGSEWQSEVFTDEDLTESDLRGAQFEGCEFVDCKFTDADLSDAQFDDCTWLRCEMSNCNVANTRFRGASFVESRVRGVQWSSCYRFALEFKFTDCNLSYSSFFGLHLRGIEITGSCLREVDFGECSLIGAKFTGSDLGGAIFHRTDLTRADMSSAQSIALDLNNNKVKGLRISLGGAVGLLDALGVEVVFD